MSVHLNILCLIRLNRQYPQNCIEFDSNAWVLLIFQLKYSKTRTIINTYGYSGLNSTWPPFALITIVSHFGSWSIAWFNLSCLSWAQQPIRTCFCWSVSEICDDTPSAAMLPTLNNPCALDPDCLAARHVDMWRLLHQWSFFAVWLFLKIGTLLVQSWRQKQSKYSQNSKNDHWCANRRMSTQSPPNTQSHDKVNIILFRSAGGLCSLLRAQFIVGPY